MTKVTFQGVDYTEEDLTGKPIEELLTLRNTVATELGVAQVASFKDQTTAEKQTWKALQRAGSAAESEKAPKKAKPKAPKKTRALAKSAESKIVKRPTKKMFSIIKKTGEHDGTQGRAHRWPNYKDGMTLVDVLETEGTEPFDVHMWVKEGIMSLTEVSDEQFAEMKAAWYKKHGLTDPEEAKRLKAEERAAAKAEREKAAAEKKAEREKVKAEKAAAREKAKAEKAAAAAAKAKA